MIPKKILEEFDRFCKDKKLAKKEKKEARKKLEELYEHMKVEPGEAVGELASQSLGEPGTQMMMESIHAIGMLEAKAIKTVLGLPRLIEIFDARREPETPTMKIYLKKEYATDPKKAEQVVEKLKETSLEEIADLISLNLSELSLEVEISKEDLKSKGLSYKELIEKLKRRRKIVIEREKNLLRIKPEGSYSVKDLYKLKRRLRDKNVSGIENIKAALAKKRGKKYVIDTEGSNLAEVLKLEEIDPTKTTSNDLWEIYRVLGIEAVRSAIIREAMKTLEEQGQEVDIRHVMLLADLMTTSGRLRGITRYGIPGSKASVLARASFEVPLRHLKRASIRAEEDRLEGPVENIIIGQIPPTGTGMLKLMLKGAKSESK